MEAEIRIKIINFAKQIVCGKVMDSPEDMQFYLNYRKEIEEVLLMWSKD